MSESGDRKFDYVIIGGGLNGHENFRGGAGNDIIGGDTNFPRYFIGSVIQTSLMVFLPVWFFWGTASGCPICLGHPWLHVGSDHQCIP